MICSNLGKSQTLYIDIASLSTKNLMFKLVGIYAMHLQKTITNFLGLTGTDAFPKNCKFGVIFGPTLCTTYPIFCPPACPPCGLPS